MSSHRNTHRLARAKAIITLLMVVGLLSTCGRGPGGRMTDIRWSRSVDSLLRDTTTLAVPLDSLRDAVTTATTDSGAWTAAAALGAGLRTPVGDRLVAEVRDLCRTAGDTLGEANAQYWLARIAIRQDHLSAADSLLRVTDALLEDRSQTGWALLRMKVVYSKADLKRYAREPVAALNGFHKAMAMAERLNDHEWIAACEAALGGTYLSDLKFDSARVHCERCVEMARQAGDRDRMASCHNFLGEMYRIQKDFDKAVAHQREALTLAEGMNNRGRMAENLYSLGEIYRQKDDFPRALESYQLSLGHAEAMGMQQVAAIDLLYMGDIHRGLEEYDTALVRYRKADAIAKAAGMPYIRSICLIHAGRVEGDLKQPAAGIKDVQEALMIADSMANDELARNGHNAMGELLQSQGKFDDAANHYRSALENGRRSGIADERFYAQQMAAIQLAKGDLPGARALGESAMRFAKSANAGPLEVAMAADLLYRVYRSTGLGEKAADMLELKVAMNDSVFNAKQLRKMSNLELKAQQEKMLAQRERERAHELLAIAAERNRRNLFAVVGAAVLLLAVALWSRLRVMRRARDTILRTQQQLVASEKQREAEQVRTRIARDVHDELGSELTRISLLVGQSRKEQAGTSSAHRMDEIASLTREVSSSLSDIVWAVDPQHDSVESLVAHAQHFTERMLENVPVELEQRFMHVGPDRMLDPATKRNIFLLLKESLNNALKYARAQHITVSLETSDWGFKLLVKDDGVGFEQATARGEGNGLANMKSRCAALGALLRVTTLPGEGCTVEVEGPLA